MKTLNNNITMNDYAEKLIENRYVGVVQLTADDLGGSSKIWQQYRTCCDNITIAAYKSLNSSLNDEYQNALGICVSALFSFFEVNAKATPEYQNRLVASVIERKIQKSDECKQAIKDKTKAKKNLNKAIEAGKSKEEISALEDIYNQKTDIVDELKLQPMHYWFDLNPMLDKSKKHATAKARKAIEDCIADIITQRALMTPEQLQAEAQRLEDERKGRNARKAKEAKAEA